VQNVDTNNVCKLYNQDSIVLKKTTDISGYNYRFEIKQNNSLMGLYSLDTVPEITADGTQIYLVLEKTYDSCKVKWSYVLEERLLTLQLLGDTLKYKVIYLNKEGKSIKEHSLMLPELDCIIFRKIN